MAAVGQKDIARLAGVSRSTVAFALHDHLHVQVNPHTRERVLETARQLGYRPHPLARGLRGGSTNSAGMLWTLSGAPTAAQVAGEIALRLHRKDYMVFPVDHLAEPELTRRSLAEFQTRGVDAVILQCPPRLATELDLESELAEFRASLVVFLESCSYTGDHIVHERAGAFRAVADHLVECGRRRPAILIFVASNRSKVEAFLSQLQLRGIPREDCPIIDLPAPPNGAELSEVEKCLENHFASGIPFDALLCGTDEYAVAAIHWLRRRGLRVPEDVAVVGMNDNPVSRYLDPPLASIARADGRLCECIAELLFRRLEQSSAPPQRRTVPMQFVWRESAGARPLNEARTG